MAALILHGRLDRKRHADGWPLVGFIVMVDEFNAVIVEAGPRESPLALMLDPLVSLPNRLGRNASAIRLRATSRAERSHAALYARPVDARIVL